MRENHGNSWLTSTNLQVWTEEKTLLRARVSGKCFQEKIFFSRFLPYAQSCVYMGVTLLISNKDFKLFLLSEPLLILLIKFIVFLMR